MVDQRITAEELLAELREDLKALAEKIAAAMNAAQAGRIIADTEEPVRDAHAQAWREDMTGYAWNQGSLVMLDHLADYLRVHRSGPKAEALRSLRGYVAKRVEMTDYPKFRQMEYDCGSGPTESFCGTLRLRLKGRGMHWDKHNAEAMMALGSLYYSNQWKDYWARQRAA